MLLQNAVRGFQRDLDEVCSYEMNGSLRFCFCSQCGEPAFAWLQLRQTKGIAGAIIDMIGWLVHR